MDTPVRVDATQAYQKVQSGEALLVCAYKSQEKCERLRLANAMTLQEFQARLHELSRDTEIIFYCT